MVSKSEKTTRNVGIGAGIIVVVLLCVFLWPSGIGPANFSIRAEDGPGNHAITDNDVLGDLWGAKASADLAVFIDDDGVNHYDLLQSFTDLSAITAAQMSAYKARGFTQFWINGSTTADADANRTWLTYEPTWFSVNPDSANVLTFTAHPTTHWISIINEAGVTYTTNMTKSETITGWTTANAIGNFSVIVGINKTDVGYAGFAGYWNVEAQAYTKARVVFSFNGTVVASGLSLAGYSSGNWARSTTQYNTTAIAFETDTITAITVLDFNWSADMAATGWAVKNVIFEYGPVAVGAGTNTKLDDSAA